MFFNPRSVILFD